MLMNFDDADRITTLANVALENVRIFTYFITCVHYSDAGKTEIKSRVDQATAKFHSMHDLFNNRGVTMA